ncbi:hypothetical protein [Pararhodonellum marinum]|uniref:hypothetical protein n=1 Tax=Pararhodonellum marinum TaxID=2755358 RepID=UPI0018908051|nr:hypothetical protein [Pararhodonellum marinum]
MQAEGQIFISISSSLKEKFEGYDEVAGRQGVANYALLLFKAICGKDDVFLRFDWGESKTSTLVTINERKALVPDVLSRRLPFMDTTECFIQYISRALLINRALFLSDALLDTYLGDFFDFSSDVQRKWRQLGQLFIAFGHNLSLLSDLVDKDIQALPLHKMFEEAVQGHMSVGISFTVNPEMISWYHEADGSRAEEILQLMCQGIYFQYGIVLPAVSLRVSNELPLYQGLLYLNDLPLPALKTIDGGYFVCNQPETNPSMNFDHLVTPGHPNTSGSFSIRPMKTFEQGLYSSWGTWGVWVLQLSGYVRQYAGWFSNGFAFDTIWDAKIQNQLMGQRLSEKYDKAFLTHVWRRLHQQGMFTRSFYRVLEGLLLARQSVLSDNNTIEFFHHPMVLSVDIHPAESALQDPVQLAEGVRNYLKHELVANFSFPATFWVLLLDPSFEDALFGNEDFMGLAPALLDKLEFEIRNFPAHQVLHGILTVDAIRHKVEALLGETYPFLKVIAYNELPADANIQTISRLTPVLSHSEEDQKI